MTTEELEDHKLVLEGLKLSEEIEKLSAEKGVAQLQLRQAQREDAALECAPGQSRIYTFYGAVTSAYVDDAMLQIGRWSRRDPGEDITVIFNSPGGSVFDGLALYDFLIDLRSQGHKIITVARGMAASMGGILLQAGDERVVGANCHMLIHEVSTGAFGKMSEVEDEVKFTKRLQERLVVILAERSTLSERQVRTRWGRRDWWLDAVETVELGFADRVG